jgi:hypothetical protein
MPIYSDRDLIAVLVARYKTPRRAMASLGLTMSTYYNWMARGVPRHWRRPLWLLCRARRIHIDQSWITMDKTPGELAAIRRASGFTNTSNGGGNGEKEASDQAEPQGQRRRRRTTDQRRPAAGRDVPDSTAQDQAGSR